LIIQKIELVAAVMKETFFRAMSRLRLNQVRIISSGS